LGDACPKAFVGGGVVMVQVLEDIGIDGVMVLSIVVALSCLVYLVMLTVRERATNHAEHRRQ
jgi:hypothetical protein